MSMYRIERTGFSKATVTDKRQNVSISVDIKDLKKDYQDQLKKPPKIFYPDSREKLYLLIKKYKKEITFRDIDKMIAGPYITSVFLFQINQFPLTKQARRDAEKMQRLYLLLHYPYPRKSIEVKDDQGQA